MSIYSDLKGAAASVTTVYSAAADLPLTDVDSGSQAYVSATNRLYLWNGTGWYNIALINTNPTITTGGDAEYTLANDGTATVITLVANDPEGVPITWSHAVSTGSLGSTATVSQVDNEFTVTPSSTEADAGTFSLTFTASDGINTATSTSEFTLAFGGASYDWSQIDTRVTGTTAGYAAPYGKGRTALSTSIAVTTEDDANGFGTGRGMSGNSTHTFLFYTDDSNQSYVGVYTLAGVLVKTFTPTPGSSVTGGWRAIVSAGERYWTFYREGVGTFIYDLTAIADADHGLVATFTTDTALSFGGWVHGNKFIVAYKNAGQAIHARDATSFRVYNINSPASFTLLHTHTVGGVATMATQIENQFYIHRNNGNVQILNLDDYTSTNFTLSATPLATTSCAGTNGTHYVAVSAYVPKVFDMNGAHVCDLDNSSYRWAAQGADGFQDGAKFQITEDGLHVIQAKSGGDTRVSVWRIADGYWVGSHDSQETGAFGYCHYAGGIVASIATGSADVALQLLTVPAL